MSAAARDGRRIIGRRPDVVELRVHGVSGTPPEELLDRLRRAPGRGRRHRRLLPADHRASSGGTGRRTNRRPTRSRTPPGTSPTPPPLVEGYCWGGLTSGSPSRALWLILLPFTLANIAPRMRPVPGKAPEDWPRASAAVWFLSPADGRSASPLTLTLGASGHRAGHPGVAVRSGAATGSAGRCGRCSAASTPWRVLWGSLLPAAGAGRAGRAEHAQVPAVRPGAARSAWAGPMRTARRRGERHADRAAARQSGLLVRAVPGGPAAAPAPAGAASRRWR